MMQDELDHRVSNLIGWDEGKQVTQIRTPTASDNPQRGPYAVDVYTIALVHCVNALLATVAALEERLNAS